MDRETRIRLINQTLAEYFKTHSDKVPAQDFMDEFVKRGIFNQDSERHGLPLRKLLRTLDRAYKLSAIPYVVAERNMKNTNWFFAPIGGEIGKKDSIRKVAAPVKKEVTVPVGDDDFKDGLAPWISKNSKILVLGTLPGDKSIKAQAYYQNPTNQFWTIMHSIFGSGSNDFGFLDANGIALWDCLKHANRPGSLDSNIRQAKPNDLAGLLEKYPNVKKIILNGKSIMDIFERYFPQLIAPYNVVALESTSSANTHANVEGKTKAWKRAIESV